MPQPAATPPAPMTRKAIPTRRAHFEMDGRKRRQTSRMRVTSRPPARVVSAAPDRMSLEGTLEPRRRISYSVYRDACGRATNEEMFALGKGELAIALFIFVLVWVAGVLPEAAERLAGRTAANRAR